MRQRCTVGRLVRGLVLSTCIKKVCRCIEIEVSALRRFMSGFKRMLHSKRIMGEVYTVRLVAKKRSWV